MIALRIWSLSVWTEKQEWRYHEAALYRRQMVSCRQRDCTAYWKAPVIKVKIVDENKNTVYEYNEYAPYGEHEAEADIPEGYMAVSDENLS